MPITTEIRLVCYALAFIGLAGLGLYLVHIYDDHVRAPLEAKIATQQQTISDDLSTISTMKAEAAGTKVRHKAEMDALRATSAAQLANQRISDAAVAKASTDKIKSTVSRAPDKYAKFMVDAYNFDIKALECRSDLSGKQKCYRTVH